ncbi:MAG: insulinase family protein [Prevotella sp.]|nr:insulinase family protein [Prevotella sp.]
MRQKIFLLTIITVLTAGILPAKDYPFVTVKNDLMRTRIYTLDNGLKIYLSVNKEKPRIQTYIAVRTGSRNDPAETTGLAHYLEHLMFKGTKQFGTSDYASEKPLLDSIKGLYEVYRTLKDPSLRKEYYHRIDSISQTAARYNIPNEYDKLMGSIGATGTNAFTSNDVTCYVEDIPANEIENWARVQGDRFRNMVIRGFHTELESVYEEYNISLASDDEKMWNALNKKLYPTHPYGTQTTIGTQEHLKNPSIVNIENYFRRYYVPNNMAICMAGDFDPDAVMPILDRYFGQMRRSESLSRPEYAPVADLTAPVDTTVVGQEAPQLMIGWKFKGGASWQADTLAVISDMLSNGSAGLFDQHLAQPMKVAQCDAWFEAMTDYGQLVLQAVPKQGQSLQAVRQLLIGEVDRLKRGDFDDDLLPSVINNRKLQYFNQLLSNRARANMMMRAFINGRKWEDDVSRLDRMGKMTKAQIIAFANQYLNANCVTVYKQLGEDTTIHKIDKPLITPIPANRDKSSAFLQAIATAEVAPIEPQFVDYKRDLTFGKTRRGLPVIYKRNTDDGLFDLAYRFEFGWEANRLYALAANYIDYIGTEKMTVAQFKQAFYKIACSYKISVADDYLTISLSGLNENMPKAVALMEDLMQHAKADRDSWNKYVDLIATERDNAKKSQDQNFTALYEYGVYGKYNPVRDTLTIQQLRSMDPQAMTALIKGLSEYPHTLLYYGPTDLQQLTAMADKVHRTPHKFAPAPVNKPFMEQATTQNEILLAPYEAKNIYMVMYHNGQKPWNEAETPVASLFNAYFGGSMNGIVFQELRESRGLAYSASARYQATPRLHHPEYVTTDIISQNDKMMDCIHVFNNILDTLPESEKAFQIAKQSLQKQIASARTTRFDVIESYLNARERGIDYSISERIYNALPSLTLQDLVRFERANMAQKPYRYLILGDERSLDIPALERIAPIRRLTTEEIFGY